MSITSLKARFARIVTEISEQRQELSLIYASDLTALVTDRLLNEGESAEGKKFPLYSEIDLGSLAKRVVQASNKPSAKTKKGAGSYKEIRKKLGLPIDKRTHSFTGDMIKSVRPIVEKNDKYVTVIKISADNEFAQNKINWNSNKMKTNLLRANPKERELIEKLNQKRVQNIINK